MRVKRTVFVFVLAAAALFILYPVSARGDDGDGIDDDADNCLGLANPEQRDSDEDGYGNACDADVDGDGLVTTSWGQTYRSIPGRRYRRG